MAQCSLALRSALAGRLISLVDQEGGGLIGTSFQRLDLDVRGPAAAAAAAAGRHGTGTGRQTVRRWMVPRRVPRPVPKLGQPRHPQAPAYGPWPGRKHRH